MTEPNALQTACRQAMLRLYGDTQAFDDRPEPSFSAGFLRKMRRLTAHVRGDRYHRLTRAAKVALVAALIAILAIITVTAGRQLGFLVIDNGTDAKIEIEEQNNLLKEGFVGHYIPKGFVLTEQEKLRDYYSQVYYGEDNSFFEIKVRTSYETMGVNTETRKAREIKYKDKTFMVAGTEEVPIIFWVNSQNRYFYIIHGNIPEDDLLEIAYSLEIINGSIP